MKEIITVNTDKGPLAATYTDGGPFLHWAGLQGGFSHFLDNPAVLKEEVRKRSQMMWDRQRLQKMYENLPDKPTCIEIGCGSGINAVISAQYLQESSWHLIDAKNVNVGFPGGQEWKQFTEDGSIFYSPYSILQDGINSSPVDKSKFEFNELGKDAWPSADIIISVFSWCFHYPTEVYLDKVISSLKPGGRLWLTIRVNDFDNSIEKISERLGVSPVSTVGHHKDTKDDLSRYVEHLSNYKDQRDWLKECLWIRP